MNIGDEHTGMISLATAGLIGAASLLLALRGEATARWISQFPRNRFWGIVLSAIGLIWSAMLINNMTLGGLSQYKWLLYILTPLAFYLIIQYLDELLAPRALGGILMLYPTVMVEAARWHDSSWRLVVVGLAYVMVTFGAWLMLCPFKFRVWGSALASTPSRRMAAAIVLVVLTILLILSARMTA
jgi:hypothetical protein